MIISGKREWEGPNDPDGCSESIHRQHCIQIQVSDPIICLGDHSSYEIWNSTCISWERLMQDAMNSRWSLIAPEKLSGALIGSWMFRRDFLYVSATIFHVTFPLRREWWQGKLGSCYLIGYLSRPSEATKRNNTSAGIFGRSPDLIGNSLPISTTLNYVEINDKVWCFFHCMKE